MKTSKQYLTEFRLKREEVKSFDTYPFSLAAVRPLETLELHPAVTFFVGENGSGKSTLLEAIAVACGFNAEGGSRNFRFGTRDSHSELHHFLRVARGFPRPRHVAPFAFRGGDVVLTNVFCQGNEHVRVRHLLNR